MATDAFDRIVTLADGAMVVVTAAVSPQRTTAERGGCLVGFHCQTSIDPERYGVWISKANHTYRVALLADHVAVHLLGVEDFEIAEHFGTTSGDESDKFEGWAVSEGPGGVPLLDRCPNRFVIQRDALIDVGGDHVLFTGAVVEAAMGDEPPEPLRLSGVSDLESGHGATERPAPRTERAG